MSPRQLAISRHGKKQFDTILFKQEHTSTEQYEIIDSAWLLRPALAKSLLPEPEAVAPGGTAVGEEEEVEPSEDKQDEGKDEGVGGGVKIIEGERRVSRVRISTRIPWENWHDIYNEVIDPLAREGANIICDVVILAKGEDAIRENIVELGIKESFSQRVINADIDMS